MSDTKTQDLTGRKQRLLTTRLRAGAIWAAIAGLGLLIGLTVRADGLFQIVSDVISERLHADAQQSEKEKQSGHPDNIIELTDSQIESLGLVAERVVPKDYVRTVLVPAMVIEKPGHSGRTVSSKVHAIVRHIHCSPGQLLEPGEPVFDLELTGDAFVTSQVALLETLLQIETRRKELDRVTDLVKKQIVPARQKIELEYEMQRLTSRRELRRKELLVRGLTPQQINAVEQTGHLLDRITIRVPSRKLQTPKNDSADDSSLLPDVEVQASTVASTESEFYTVEKIDVHPGESVAPGQQLAHLAWHDVLFVEGYAFERDLEQLAEVHRRGSMVAIEFGAHDKEVQLHELQVHFMDNHVDPDTGTFRFYLNLANEVLIDSQDDEGRTYRSWRFKPGQRLHVRIPVETLTRQFVVPEEAVVSDSLQAFVFRRNAVLHLHAEDEAESSDHEHAYEFEKLPVKVLYRDKTIVVLSSAGKLRPNDRIAMNNAHQLSLAMQSGGGGHGHDHPHPH